MIIPAIFLAIHIVVKSFRLGGFFIYLAILCWIIANSYWMAVEFFFDDNHRGYAAIPFALGFLFVVLHYLRAPEKAKAEEAVI